MTRASAALASHTVPQTVLPDSVCDPWSSTPAHASAIRSIWQLLPSRRRDCHFDDTTPLLSLLKYLIKVEGLQ